MANPKHIAILRQGVAAWNSWRAEHPRISPNLSGANLRKLDLAGANLSATDLRNVNAGGQFSGKTKRGPEIIDTADWSGADLHDAKLQGANLMGTDLEGADLHDAELQGANLRSALLDGADLRSASLAATSFYRANLRRADLRGVGVGYGDPPSFYSANLAHARLDSVFFPSATFANANLEGAALTGAWLVEANFTGANLHTATCVKANLAGANFRGANLSEADLSQVDLRRAVLVDTVLEGACVHDCNVYGISAWNVRLCNTSQRGLVITDHDPPIVVDNLEIAQFLYLLLHNEKIRSIIDTVTSKVVLLLGRFTPERKAVLDAVREELRTLDYVPVIFDSDKPATRDTQETITLLARMARFVIADITEAKSIPQELGDIVPDLPSVPVQPIIHEAGKPWGMYDRIRRYPWVLPIQQYSTLEELLPRLHRAVIAPAEAKVKEIRNQTGSQGAQP